jgi:hypothetical protein
MFMVMFVLDDVIFADDILNSWSEIGITNATIFDSRGLNRRLKKVIPMRYAFNTGVSEETGKLTFFVMVETDQMVKACLDAIEKIVGDLNQPNTGIFTAWPLSIIKGIPPLEQKER